MLNTRGSGGFTLVELAIVLVIVGLLLGAILRGQAMIQNAKMKRLKSDVDGLVAAVFSYQDAYGALPGDDPNASKRWSGMSDGNGDGIWQSSEGVKVWQHLIRAGLISGDYTETSETRIAKRNPFGGRYLFRYYGGSIGKNYLYVDNVPYDVARALDEKYDDGKYWDGSIRLTGTRGLVDMRWFVF